MADSRITSKTIRDWAPLVAAVLGAGIVWGSTTGSLATLEKRVAAVEIKQAEEAEWRRSVDLKLRAILCVLSQHDARCLEM